jgi:hypothetical protein
VNYYKNLILLMSASLLAILFVWLGVQRVHFDPAQAIPGSEFARLSAEQLKVNQRARVAAPTLRNPFSLQGEAPKDFPPVPLSEAVASGRSTGGTVSMILLQEGRRMALLDDQVVKEGDHFSGKRRVLRIEEKRVLVQGQDGRRQWIPLAQEKANIGESRTDRKGNGSMVPENKERLPEGKGTSR